MTKLSIMKMKLTNIWRVLICMIVFASCSEDKLSDISVFGDPITEQNDFDKWIYSEYTIPYNILFKYRFEDIESSMGYYLTPADYNQSIALAKMVKNVCLEVYDVATGSTAFIRSYFPKIIFLSGSPAYKNNGSMILGTAEGGKKITLFNVDALDVKTVTAETEYFKTIHHEFAHILNQTKPFSMDFNQITGNLYVGDSCWDVYPTEASALTAGFISRYSSSAAGEDFVELISIFITRSAEKWEAKLVAAGNNGRPIIEEKFDIVYNYMLNSWGINLYELRELVLANANNISNLDLYSLD